MKIFGTITLDSTMKRWVIECEPHVAKQLKRWFPRIDETQRGVIHLADTDANGRELLWITERFPMAVVPDDYLRARAENQLRTEAAVQEVLRLDYTPPAFDLALPPRPYQAQAAALLLKNGALLLADDLGLGKAQPLDAKVLTPRGWVTMGTLQVGDEVIDPCGGTATVTGVFPQGEREVFRVKTADGATTECCDEHLWEVRTPNDRKRGGSRVLPLSEIRSRLHYTYPGQRTSRFFLPTCEPVQYAPAGPLPIDPYLLGVLIGDGCFRTPCMSVMLSTADEEILEAVRATLPAGVRTVKADGKYDWRLSFPGPGNPLSRSLRALDLAGRRSWEKHVPPLYLRSSVEQRLALLQGLMDTDGTCGSDGVTTYTTTSPDLASEVAELVGSLGGFASTYSRQPKYTYKSEKRTGRRAYTLNVRMPVCPFRLAKKKARWHRPYLARAIQEVTSVGTKPVQCIRVSSKRSLYITDGFIVTHNTVSAICAMADKRALPCVVVTMTHLPIQWRRELARFAPKLTVHVVRGGPVYDVRSFGRYPDVVIVPYSKLAKWATALAPHAKYVVFDEVQELRRHDSQKYAAACELRENAAYTLGLTATPVMNYGGDFYNVMNVIKEDCLGTRVEFSREWATNDVTGMSGKLVIADPQALGTYMRTTGLMLRRQYGDAGIPTPQVETIVHEIECDEDTIEAAEGRASELARIILDQTAMGFDKLRASEELNHLMRQATGIAKGVYVAAFVRALVESGEPVVLAGWHRAVYEIWLEKLKDLNPLMYTGSESPAQKQRMRDAFVEGKSNLLVMSLRSGAGLDGLQERCRVAVFGELDWSPGIHKQLLGRLARFGQTKPVMGYYLTADCGSDPVVSDVLGLKAAQADGIMDPDKEVLEQQAVDTNRIKNLARAVLENMGRR